MSLAPGKLISPTKRSGKKRKRKKNVWETGAQHTCVIITSVQAACHIRHRGAENHRGTAEKTKSVCLQSPVFFFFYFFAKICLARMTSTLRCSAEGRLGFFLWPLALVIKTGKVTATVLAPANVAKQRHQRVATAGDWSFF